MNRSALKNYAPKARLDFIRAVTDRAAFFGLTPDRTEPIQETGDVVIIGGRAFPRVVAEQRKKLQERINQHGFDQVMEAMAYTWFNRFVALRYMELHGYLDHGYRVLSHPEGKPTPEILEHAEHVTLPGLDAQQVINLKLDGSREAELYRLLLVAQCNALHEAMPFLFEKIADETELLLPDNLLHSDSIIRKLVNELDEADWQKVEIIGWLYQFYISDKKDEVIGKVVKSEDIPAATQLFTPNWIVKYLVQNTLGRQWLATYPDSPLRQQMEYYIEPAEQTEEVKAQLAAITPKSLNPETLTLLDPASGSGHILVEAYDLFKAIYQERGYRSKDIPRLILEKNLFGLEIDDRAAQLAAFALLMKARADDRRIFADRIQPNVVAIQESKGLDSLLTPDTGAAVAAGELPFTDSDLFPDTQKQFTLSKPAKGSPLTAVEPCLRELIKLFEHGKTFGSLIRVPPNVAAQLPTARQHIEAMIATGQLWEHRVGSLLLPLVKQAEVLAKTYIAVVTNPPYMGNKYLNPHLKAFLANAYAGFEKDLFSAFIIRNSHFATDQGLLGFMSPFVWMFISSYEELRKTLLNQATLTTLIQLEYSGFAEATVPICTFTFLNTPCKGHVGCFVRLSDFRGSEVQAPRTLEAIRNLKCGWFYTAIPADFKKIPGYPIAYWISEQVRKCFRAGRSLADICSIREGINTGDNDRFLRKWYEVSFARIDFQVGPSGTSKKRWVPHKKGGTFRRWFGNLEFVLNWEDNGRDIHAFHNLPLTYNGAPVRGKSFFFHESLSWSRVSSGSFSIRYYPQGLSYDSTAPSVFASGNHCFLILGFLNSQVTGHLLGALSPTLDYRITNTGYLPMCRWDDDLVRDVTAIVRECVALAKADWDSFETSWNFQGLPWRSGDDQLLCGSYERWKADCRAQVMRMKELEGNNNKLWITAYGVQNETAVETLETPVALTVNPAFRYGQGKTESDYDTMFRYDSVTELISYAVGCMMGRYSLDEPWLVYAASRNDGFDPGQYRTFPADADGIIPITELAWFPDDTTERFGEFIAKAWPREHLEENLKFIADSLGPNRDEHPRDTIRRYLATAFYKNHLQTYKRRPIYWLFSSGKQRAFQCLVYLHRYHEGTLARMRTEYVIPLQGKMSHRIEQLAGDITAATSTSHRRKLEKEKEHLVKQSTELAAFDEKLRHYADQRIALDLDNGVKVNYGKFGDLLAEVKAITGGTEE